VREVSPQTDTVVMNPGDVYLLRTAEGSELAAKNEVHHQLQLLRTGASRGV
jgi:hypothetical protein